MDKEEQADRIKGGKTISKGAVNKTRYKGNIAVICGAPTTMQTYRIKQIRVEEKIYITIKFHISNG